jgi:hypothetical protein
MIQNTFVQKNTQRHLAVFLAVTSACVGIGIGTPSVAQTAAPSLNFASAKGRPVTGSPEQANIFLYNNGNPKFVRVGNWDYVAVNHKLTPTTGQIYVYQRNNTADTNSWQAATYKPTATGTPQLLTLDTNTFHRPPTMVAIKNELHFVYERTNQALRHDIFENAQTGTPTAVAPPAGNTSWADATLTGTWGIGVYYLGGTANPYDNRLYLCGLDIDDATPTTQIGGVISNDVWKCGTFDTNPSTRRWRVNTVASYTRHSYAYPVLQPLTPSGVLIGVGAYPNVNDPYANTPQTCASLPTNPCKAPSFYRDLNVAFLLKADATIGGSFTYSQNPNGAPLFAQTPPYIPPTAIGNYINDKAYQDNDIIADKDYSTNGLSYILSTEMTPYAVHQNTNGIVTAPAAPVFLIRITHNTTGAGSITPTPTNFRRPTGLAGSGFTLAQTTSGIYAIGAGGYAFSRDGGCTWTPRADMTVPGLPKATYVAGNWTNGWLYGQTQSLQRRAVAPQNPLDTTIRFLQEATLYENGTAKYKAVFEANIPELNPTPSTPATAACT